MIQEPMVLVERERAYRQFVEDAWSRKPLVGLAPVAKAIAYHESLWRAGATNLIGPDGDMGGAYGLFQMTMVTAHDLGFKGTPEKLLDPQTNAQLAAKLMARNLEALQGAGREVTVEELVAAHNCGAGHVKRGTIPRSTSHDYVPSVMKVATERYGFKPGWNSAPTLSGAAPTSPAPRIDTPSTEGRLECTPDDAETADAPSGPVSEAEPA